MIKLTKNHAISPLPNIVGGERFNKPRIEITGKARGRDNAKEITSSSKAIHEEVPTESIFSILELTIKVKVNKMIINGKTIIFPSPV